MAREPGAFVGMTAALAGFLFVASAGAARGTDLRTDLGDLEQLVSSEMQHNDVLEVDITGLDADVREATVEAGAASGLVAEYEGQAAALAGEAGLEGVRGEGLVVTLDDAGEDCRTRVENTDFCVVHQQDVQAVVNALWSAGADGIMLMDQRLISTSAVRCVGNTLSLQGTVYSPPYEVTAVGDPDALRAALDSSYEVGLYVDAVDTLGLGYSVTRRDEVSLPAYSGPVNLQYATVVQTPTATDGETQ